MNQQYRSSCCRRAFINGSLFAKGELTPDGIAISVEKSEYAEFLKKPILEFFGAKAEIGRSTDGGRRVVLTFDSKSCRSYLENFGNGVQYVSKCDMCTASFLRGVFLVSGRISDPTVQYSLELSLGDRCEVFVEYLAQLGVNAGISDKQKERVVYIKNGNVIEDFCGHAGMNKAMFAFMDARAEGELRKNAMRVANCETNNIEKSVTAARRQLTVIAALEESGLLSFLPDELESTARLRMTHADLSLSQLAAIAVPPISKPGLSHRLKKIIELGEQILKKHNGEEE